jgi:hypothetical protein
VSQFNYLETTVTNQNLIQEEIERGFNTCYHSVRNLLSSRLLSRIEKLRIFEIVILPVVLYERKTLSLILRVKHRLRVFENRVLRGMHGPKENEVTGVWRILHIEELHNLYFSPSIIRMIN